MPEDVTIPNVGESVTEGVLAKWLVDDDGFVEVDQPIYELETDKITTEVQSLHTGKISQKVAEGETVAVDAVIATIDTDAERPDKGGDEEDAEEEEGSEDADEKKKKKKKKKKDREGDAEEEEKDRGRDSAGKKSSSDRDGSDGKGRSGKSRPRLSPAVARLVREHDLDPDAIEGSGKGGRLTKGDVLEHLESVGDDDRGKRDGRARKRQPSGDRRTRDEPARERRREKDEDEGPKRRPLSPLRRKIAQRLVNAQRTAAILTTFNEIDMHACMAMRKRHKQGFEERRGVGLGFMSFFVRASCEALRAYPMINNQIEGDDLLEHDRIHVGVAVGTERGLLVPVLRDADHLDFAGIESGIRVLAKKARDGKIDLSDLEGGTFTITNGGVFGSMLSTPILNPPQSGILGMHAIKERPVAVDGEVVIRPMMYVALSYDHRIVDGAEAVGFLVRIKELIEEPERLLLGL